MNEDELRQACEEFANEYMDDNIMAQHGGLQLLLAFARRMQAVGVRSALQEMYRLDMREDIDYEGVVDRSIDWCEAEAKRLEQTK